MEPQRKDATQQCRIELTLNDEITNQQAATVTINAPDQPTAKNLVSKLLGTETKFMSRADGGFDIYHPKVLNGNQPCGWGVNFTVPAKFGVRSVAETRLGERIAA